MNRVIFISSVFLAYTSGGQALLPAYNIPENAVISPPPVSTFPYLTNFPGIQHRNFVRSYTPVRSGINEGHLNLPYINMGSYLSIAHVHTSYLDGLGRPLQEVQRKALNTGADLVYHHVYNNTGREEYTYKPFGSVTPDGYLNAMPLAGISAYNNGSFPKEESEKGGEPYARTLTETAFTSLVTKSMAPGHNWVGANRGIEYRMRGINPKEYVFSWKIALSGALVAVGYHSGYHPLTVVETKDEDGKVTIEYYNKSGQLICKRACLVKPAPDLSLPGAYQPNDWAQTYYVYDEFDRLRYVLSPQAIKVWCPAPPATEALEPLPGVPNSVVSGLCYKYIYDAKGRLIEKQVPGMSGSQYMVYDQADRLVLSQDPNLKADDNKWLFTIYDNQNRPVITGIYSPGAAATREVLAEQFTLTSPFGSANLFNYLKNYALYNTYPAALNYCEILTRSYYDDYSHTPTPSVYNASFDAQLAGPAAYAEPQQPAKNVRGLLVQQDVKIMDPADNNLWISTKYFYDHNGRLLQEQRRTEVQTDIITNQYDFQGNLISTVLYQEYLDAISPDPAYPDLHQSFDVVRKWERDYTTGNLTSVKQKINGSAFRTLSDLDYDKYGRILSKDYKITNQEYNYNIRGWLTGINKNAIGSPSPTIFFSEQISYDQGFGSRLYNGNIAGIQWRGAGTANKRSYGYTYDQLNRVSHAEFREHSSYTGSTDPDPDDPPGTYGVTGGTTTFTGWNKLNTDFTAHGITYDYNGNLLTMNQRGPGAGGPVDMDLLQYSYYHNSNQLNKVQEPGAADSPAPDFTNGTSGTGTDYTYDANGNLKSDANKGITDIAYSYLNKPTVITMPDKGSIEFIYDALGNLLSKRVTGLPTSSGYPPILIAPLDVTDYRGPFVYVNNKLQYFLHEEGRCRPKATATAGGKADFLYDFFLKDHLGNVRTVLNAEEYLGYEYPYEEDPNPPGSAAGKEYKTTLEVAMSGVENLIWSRLDEVRAENPAGNPEDNKSALLLGTDSTRQTGTALMLRVMPGDRFDLEAKTYYDAVDDNSDNVNGEQLISSVLTSLAGGSLYSGTPLSELPENMRTLELTMGNSNALGRFLDQSTETNYDPARPGAYLNYMVFDEQGSLTEQRSSLQIEGPASQWNTLSTPSTIEIGRPGYLLVFTSSKAMSPVWFDGVKVTFYKGAVLEENHYYPFGLTLSSSSVSPSEKNSTKFQTQELHDTYGLNWYGFKYRMHDMQTGRFTTSDPLAAQFPHNSPYAFSENRVVNGVELEGLEYLENNTGWFHMFSTPNGIDIGLRANNIPAVFRYENGSPRFSVSGLGLSAKGLYDNSNGPSFRPANDLPASPAWPFSEQMEPTDGTAGGYMGYNLETNRAFADRWSAKMSAPSEIHNYISLYRDDVPVWQAYTELLGNVTGFDKAIRASNALPFYTLNKELASKFLADVINFIYDGTVPLYNARSKRNSNGYILDVMEFGMDQLRINNVSIQGQTLDTYEYYKNENNKK